MKNIGSNAGNDQQPRHIEEVLRPESQAEDIEAPTLTVDESNFAGDDSGNFDFNFSGDFGADGEGLAFENEGIVYTLALGGTESGLVDTLSQQAVVLSLEGGDVVGRTESGGIEVFRVTVDNDGNVTLDQSRAVVHDPDTGPNQSTTLSSDDLIQLVKTLTDSDGDSASAACELHA